MSLETEILRPSGCSSVKLGEALKQPRRSYTREFLLSLTELDVCKKLPSGFDESLLGEFGEGVQSLQDRSRAPGSHHFQGVRRNDHGSSPPTWDSAHFTAGNYGKTGNHSSMQSDRDSDSQSDRDSESGKHRWQSRRSWHATEHDGLLGSGSSSKVSGFAPGISAPKYKTNDNYPLKKSNEPYQPPRPYKALPYSKKDIDSNDETFGSSDCISEDRAEGERRRRASFEQMRKQQQKALQEKLMHNVDDASGIFVQHDNKKGDVESSVHKDQVLAVDHIWKNPSGKCSAVLSSPAYRPLVPPGFRNSLLEKNPESKSNLQHALLEEGISMKEDTLGSETSFRHGTTSLERSTDKKSEVERQLPHASSGLLGDPGILKLSPHVLNDKAVVDSNTGPSNSLLERMFWGPVSTDGHGVSSQNEVCKPDDARSAGPVQSSRFAQGFFEADAKSSDDLSSGRPADILSLIVSGDKSRYQVSGSETIEHFSDDIFLNNVEQSRKLLSASSPADSVFNGQAPVPSKEKSFPTILTCEDLENSILTEYSAQTTSNLPPSNPWSVYQNVEPSTKHVDDNASLHLLSLLQRNSDQSKDEEISIANITLSEPSVPQSTVAVTTETKENDKSSATSENKLTLEMLFGSAFMKELQSVEAPLSIQRGLSGSAEVQAADPHGIPFPYTDTRMLSAVDPINFQRSRSDQMLHSFNHQKQTEPRSAEHLVGYSDSKFELASLNPHANEVPEYGRLDGSAEFQMPKDSIISSNGPQGYQMLAQMPAISKNNEHFSRNALLEHMDRHLTTTVVKDGSNVLGSEIMAPKYGSYENMEPELHFRNLPLHHPSPQFQHSQMAQVRPLHGSMESSPAPRTSQVEVLGPETFYNHDSLASNRHFPSNVHPFYDPSIGIPRPNVASHHPIMHQMRIPGNYSPQMMTDLPRAGNGSNHGIQEAGFLQENNSSFPFPAQQRILGNLLPSTPGTGIIHRNHPPEAFQRLVELEKSAHLKQLGSGHSQGIPWT